MHWCIAMNDSNLSPDRDGLNQLVSFHDGCYTVKPQINLFRQIVPIALVVGLFCVEVNSGVADEIPGQGQLTADSGIFDADFPEPFAPALLDAAETNYDGEGIPPAPDGGAAAAEGATAADPWASFEMKESDSPFEYFEPSYYQEGEYLEDEPSIMWRLGDGLAHLIERPLEPMAGIWERITGEEHVAFESCISEDVIGIQPIFPRVALPFEYPERYLAMDDVLGQGVELPTGAIWRPTLWIWGVNRAAIQQRDDQGPRGANFTELVQRLDIFGSINLTGTEHVLIAVRPFDEEENRQGLRGREFTSYDLKDGFPIDGMNGDLQSMYFEGEFCEIFPNIDIWDFNYLDYGFSVGRQPMSFQRGILINEDMIDAATITRNTIAGNGVLNGRMTAVYAWNRVTRFDGNFSNSDAEIYGLFTEWDFGFNTLNVDVGFLDDDPRGIRGGGRNVGGERVVGGDMAFYGISSTQRIVGYENTYNTRFHVVGSHPTDGETRAAGEGTMFFSQMSWTPHHGEDLIYINGFWAIDRFTSPARAPLAGGPLGDVGLLFASVALGRFGPAINNTVNKDAGAALGYQMFFNERRQQIVVEFGGKKSTDGPDDGILGLFFRSQTAVGQNWIVVTDAFVAKQESRGGSLNEGLRLEFLYNF